MATQVASETVKELTGIIREQIADTKERSASQDTTSSATSHAMKEITSGVMDAAKGIIEISVSGAKNAMGEFQRPPQSQDPIIGTLLTAMVQQMTTPKSNEEVALLRQQVEMMRNDQMTQLRNEIAAMRSNPAPAAQGSADSTVSTIKTMRELFDELGIGANPREEAPWWSSLVASGVQFLATSGPQIIQAISMANRPAPVPPTSTVTQVPNDQPHQQQANPQPAQVTGGIPGLHPDVEELLASIKRPLLRFLRDGIPGGEFAEYFIEGHGQGIFGQLKALGPDQIMQAISIYPPITTLMQAEGITAEQAQKFIAEFCMYEPKMESAA